MRITANFVERREIVIDDATAVEIAVALLIKKLDLRDATEIRDGFLVAHVEDGMGGTYESPRRVAMPDDALALQIIKRLRAA